MIFHDGSHCVFPSGRRPRRRCHRAPLRGNSGLPRQAVVARCAGVVYLPFLGLEMRV